MDIYFIINLYKKNLNNSFFLRSGPDLSYKLCCHLVQVFIQPQGAETMVAVCSPMAISIYQAKPKWGTQAKPYLNLSLFIFFINPLLTVVEIQKPTGEIAHFFMACTERRENGSINAKFSLACKLK